MTAQFVIGAKRGDKVRRLDIRSGQPGEEKIERVRDFVVHFVRLPQGADRISSKSDYRIAAPAYVSVVVKKMARRAEVQGG